MVLAFAINGSESIASASDGSSAGSYGGVMHIDAPLPGFYVGDIATLPVSTTSQQSNFGDVPSQLGSYDWTIEMSGWSLNSTVNGQQGSVSGGEGGIYSTFESAYPYILLPLADADKICEFALHTLSRLP